MIFVNTTLEVALLKETKNRDRVLPRSIAKHHIEKLQKILVDFKDYLVVVIF